MVLEATLQVNSYIVSGLAKLAWQTLPTFAIYKLAEVIIASFNLHQIYDRRTTLTPRNSLLFTLTNAPVGHPPIVLLLSIVLLLHIAVSIVLDLSINGETRRVHEPLVYDTVIASHNKATPLNIDYAREFTSTDATPGQIRFPNGVPEGKRLVSRRLIGISEANACLFLNGTHHTNFAHAYKDSTLDKKLVPATSKPPLGTCVSSTNFKNEKVSVRFKRSGFPKASCYIKSMDVTYDKTGDNVIGVGKPTLGDCDLDFDDFRCFNLGADHCAAIARRKRKLGEANYFIYIGNASYTKGFGLHELRFPPMQSAEERARFASNVAFTQALGLRASEYNAMFVAIAEVRYNVTLEKFEQEREVTVINLPMLISVAVAELIGLGTLCAVAVWMWVNWVARKKRQKYITFTSLLDVFAMVSQHGFVKKHEKHRVTRLVALVGDEPGVYVDENHLDRDGGVSKRVSELTSEA